MSIAIFSSIFILIFALFCKNDGAKLRFSAQSAPFAAVRNRPDAASLLICLWASSARRYLFAFVCYAARVFADV